MPSLELVKQLANKYNVNTHVVPLSILHKAVEIEHEHKDVIGDNPEIAFKIAMDHLREYPDYYQRLIKLEAKADEYWRNKVKPNIYTNGTTHSTKVGATRNETTTAKPKRGKRDVYGVRKGVRARRVQHFYPDYIPKQAPRQDERKTSQPKVKGYIGKRTTETGTQTEESEQQQV